MDLLKIFCNQGKVNVIQCLSKQSEFVLRMTFSLNKAINNAPDTFVPAIFDSMLRDTFECILQNLDLYDNEELHK